MITRFSTLRMLSLVCLFMLAVSCAKEPTPEENSITPAQFTAEKFAAVQTGQNWSDVMQSLGTPYGYFDIGKGRKRYAFSKAKDQTKKYAAYDVVVGADGKVSDKSVFAIYQE